MVIVIVLLCAGLAWFSSFPVRYQARAVADIQRVGGEIFYDYQLTSGNFVKEDARIPATKWQRELLGDHYFIRPSSINLAGKNVSDNDVRDFCLLRGVKFLRLNNTQISDLAASDLVKMRSLETLELGSTKLTDKGLQILIGLPNLKVLNIYGTGVTPVSLYTSPSPRDS